MIGAIIGDIVGSVYEFHNLRSVDFPFFSPEGFFTDDSVMTVAVARALLLHRQTGADFASACEEQMLSLGRAYPDAGYGGSFRLWLGGVIKGPYNSFGNGSAMRVSPCADLADSLEQALSYAECSAAVTHNHPEGIRGAKATALAAYLAKTGASKADIQRAIADSYYTIDFTLDDIRASYRFNETCQGSVPQALAAFFESTDFENAIRLAVSIGGDSDTIAAITGAIAWPYYKMHDPDFEKTTLPLAQKAFRYLPPDWLPVIYQVDGLR